MTIRFNRFIVAASVFTLATMTAQAEEAASDQAQWWSTQQRYETSEASASSSSASSQRSASGATSSARRSGVSSRASANAKSSSKAEPIDYEYRGGITHIEIGPEGLPCNVRVEGSILDEKSKEVGNFVANFTACPSFVGVAPELEGNLYRIPAGTVMPAWDGKVDYFTKDGDIFTSERAWIFPLDMSNPYSPLGVLSTSSIDGGSRKFSGASGRIVTPDGTENVGSLLGTAVTSK